MTTTVEAPAGLDMPELQTALRARKSIIARGILRLYRLPYWLLIAGAVLFLALPFLFALVRGELSAVMTSGLWRTLLVEPLIALYIIILLPIMARTDYAIISSMRPVVLLDDAAYTRTVLEAEKPHNVLEILAFGAGLAFGTLAERPEYWRPEFAAYYPYGLLTAMLMYGLLAWIIVGSLFGTRLSGVLLRQPLRVDIFDLAPFEPIGRQSLMLSFSFVVGTTLSLIFAVSFENLLLLPNLIVYSVLLGVTVAVFFLNMQPTHRVLAEVKAEERADAEQHISGLYRRLQQAAKAGHDAPTVAAELSTWLAMEQRLKLARTWPYNTEMLRTLAVSVLTPVAVGASRIVIAFLQN